MPLKSGKQKRKIFLDDFNFFLVLLSNEDFLQSQRRIKITTGPERNLDYEACMLTVELCMHI